MMRRKEKLMISRQLWNELRELELKVADIKPDKNGVPMISLMFEPDGECKVGRYDDGYFSHLEYEFMINVTSDKAFLKDAETYVDNKNIDIYTNLLVTDLYGVHNLGDIEERDIRRQTCIPFDDIDDMAKCICECAEEVIKDATHGTLEFGDHVKEPDDGWTYEKACQKVKGIEKTAA